MTKSISTSISMDTPIKLWAQVFFDDGSLTPPRYLDAKIMDSLLDLKRLAASFLSGMNRQDGVLFIWGAGNIWVRRCESFITVTGSRKIRFWKI